MPRQRNSPTVTDDSHHTQGEDPANTGNPYRWHVKQLSSSNSHVPALPGIYVIGHTRTYHGLVIARHYAYVGKTDNLRRRLTEHLPANEQNPALRNYIRDLTPGARCWYTMVDAAKLDRVERELITKLDPKFNTIGKLHPKIRRTNGESD